METASSTEKLIQVEPAMTGSRAARTSTPKSESHVISPLPGFPECQDAFEISPLLDKGSRTEDNHKHFFLLSPNNDSSVASDKCIAPHPLLEKCAKPSKPTEKHQTTKPSRIPRSDFGSLDISEPRLLVSSAVKPSGRLLSTTSCHRNPCFDSAAVETPCAPGFDVEERCLDLLPKNRHTPETMETASRASPRDQHEENRAQPPTTNDYFSLNGASGSSDLAILESLSQTSLAPSGRPCAHCAAYVTAEEGRGVEDIDVGTARGFSVPSPPHFPMMQSDGFPDLSDDDRHRLHRPGKAGDVFFNDDDDDDDDDDDVAAVLRSSSFSDALFAGEDRTEAVPNVLPDDSSPPTAAGGGKAEDGEGVRGRGDGEGEGEREEGDGEDQCEFCWQWFKDESSLLHHYTSSDVTRCSRNLVDSLGSLSESSPRHQNTHGASRQCIHDKIWNAEADKGRTEMLGRVTSRQLLEKAVIMNVVEYQEGIHSYITVQDAHGVVRLPITRSLAQKVREFIKDDAKGCETVEAEPGGTGGASGKDTCQSNQDESAESIKGCLLDSSVSTGYGVSCSADTLSPQSKGQVRNRWQSDGGTAIWEKQECSASLAQSEATEETWYSLQDDISQQSGENEVVNHKLSRSSHPEIGANLSECRDRDGFPPQGGHKYANVQSALPEGVASEEWEEFQSEEAESLDSINERMKYVRSSALAGKKWARPNREQTSIKSWATFPKKKPRRGFAERKRAGSDEDLQIIGSRRMAFVTPLNVSSPMTSRQSTGKEEWAEPTLDEMRCIIRDLERGNHRDRCRMGTSVQQRNTGKEPTSGSVDNIERTLPRELGTTRICANVNQRVEGLGKLRTCMNTTIESRPSRCWKSRVGEFAKGDNYCCIFCRREYASPQAFIGHFSPGRSDSCTHSLSDFLHLLQVPAVARPDWWHCQCAIL